VFWDGNLLQQVGLAHVLVGLEAARHAQIHQAILGAAAHFRRAALCHQQFQRAELAAEHLFARGAGTHHNLQFLAEIEHLTIQPVELLVARSFARANSHQGGVQALHAVDVLVDLQQREVARKLGARLSIHLDLGDGRCLKGRRRQWHGRSVVEAPGGCARLVPLLLSRQGLPELQRLRRVWFLTRGLGGASGGFDIDLGFDLIYADRHVGLLFGGTTLATATTAIGMWACHAGLAWLGG
jgi:hypothetical protein